MNLQNKGQIQRHTDIENKHGYQGGRDGGMNQKFGVKIYEIDDQQGPTVQHGELHSVSCDNR